MNIGSEWLVEAAGCRADALRDPALLEALFDRLIADLGLNPLHRPAWHVFPGQGGITGYVMLSESHLACHTYPEHGVITLNLYCCRPRPEWPWEKRLAELLGASEVRVRMVERTLTRPSATLSLAAGEGTRDEGPNEIPLPQAGEGGAKRRVRGA
jgi:S-adenosylmethionine decarboxylase